MLGSSGIGTSGRCGDDGGVLKRFRRIIIILIVILLRCKTRWRVDVGVLFRSVVGIVCRNASPIVPKQYC